MNFVIQFPDGRYLRSRSNAPVAFTDNPDQAFRFDKPGAYATIEQLALAPSEQLPRVLPDPKAWNLLQSLLQELTIADYDRVREATKFLWQHESAVADGVARLKSMELGRTNAEVQLQLTPEVRSYVANCFAAMVAESPNYTEMRFDLVAPMPEGHQWVTVHVVKASGKTPHQLRMEAEAEVAALRLQLDALRTRSTLGDGMVSKG